MFETTTVGTYVQAEHVGTALLGQAVGCHSQVQTFDGCKMLFLMRATQDGRELMGGRRERVLVQLERFLDKLDQVTEERLRKEA